MGRENSGEKQTYKSEKPISKFSFKDFRKF